jgi:hypothetical protein
LSVERTVWTAWTWTQFEQFELTITIQSPLYSRGTRPRDATMAEQTYFKVFLPTTGQNVDVMTEAGANAFVTAMPDFFGKNMEQTLSVRGQLASARGGPQRKMFKQQLVQSYTLYGCVADSISLELFEEKIPLDHLQGFLDHAIDLLTKIRDSREWPLTGILHEEDQEVLEAIVPMCKHVKFVKLMVKTDLLSLLKELSEKRQPPKLVGAPFASSMLRIINNTNLSLEVSGKTTEKSYKVIIATGILAQAIRVMTIPSDDTNAQVVILDKLQHCPGLARKKFAKDTPLGVILENVLSGKDGYQGQESRDPTIMTRLRNLQSSSAMANTSFTMPGMTDTHFCRNCSKSQFDIGAHMELQVCARCKNTYYCSRECQVA